MDQYSGILANQMPWHRRLPHIFFTRHIRPIAIERTLYALHLDLPGKHAVCFDIEAFEHSAGLACAIR